jgi:sec-independent protein translocase protein TatA
MTIQFAGMLGGWEIFLILAVVLILFGAKKLPELAKGLGQGIKEFKKASSEVTTEINRSMEEEYTPPPPPRKLPPANTEAAGTSQPQQQAAVAAPKEPTTTPKA